MNSTKDISPGRSLWRIDSLSPFIYVLILSIIVPIPYIHHFISLSSSIIPSKTILKTELLSTLAQIIILSSVLIPLSVFWPKREYRGIYRTWLFANCLSILTLPIFFFRPTADYQIAILHIGVFGLFCFCLVFFVHRSARRQDRNAATEASISIHDSNNQRNRKGAIWSITVLIVSISYLPWLTKGAFGSLLITFIQILLSLLIGYISIFLLSQFTFQPIQISNTSFWGKYFLGGSAASITLLILASTPAFPYGGMQILLMLVLPGLGWTLAALEPLGSSDSSYKRWVPLGVLVGLIASAPMVMFDSDELILVLNSFPGEILGKALQAAFISILIIFLTSAILVLIFKKYARLTKTIGDSFSTKISVLSNIAVIVSLLIAGLVYAGAGQKGFNSDYIFAILKDQADVSAARDLPDYYQRRRFVYQTLVEHANFTQKALRSSMDFIGIQYKPYYLVNGLMLPDNPFIRLWLKTRPEIDRILDNPRLRPLPEKPPIYLGNVTAPDEPQWNITLIGADRVWKDFGVMGEGIIIGQSDSGVQGDHPELVDSYRGKESNNDFNWFDPWYHTASPNDTLGHGTHTLGSIIGKNTGVAPKAVWIACVNLARNMGNPAYYLDCMQFMLAPFPQNGDPLEDGDPIQGAQVLNNSWGCPDIEGCDPNTFLSAVRALRAAGIFFVVGAGNEGPSCGTLNIPPSIYEEAFSVGAIDSSGNLASFSSIGPVTSDGSDRIKPDILAPGKYILSSLPGSTYGFSSGTSMAGPHVVGVVALMWSANPSLVGDIERTEQILIQSARPYTGYLPNCPGANDLPSTATGYGIVDAYAAVKLALGK